MINYFLMAGIHILVDKNYIFTPNYFLLYYLYYYIILYYFLIYYLRPIIYGSIIFKLKYSRKFLVPGEVGPHITCIYTLQ